MAVEVEDLGSGKRRDAARRYPPLILFIAAVVIALAVLPSALTLPRSNPAAVFEIVPSPPNNKEQNTPNANFGALDLGSSGTGPSATENGLGGAGGALPPAPNAPPPPPPPGAKGKTVFSKRCVRLPDGLHQTEDPLSPPCVANFEGDNGGSVYQGVSKDEIKILLYLDGGIVSTPTARGSDSFPSNALVDLDGDPKPNETGDLITLRSWSKYFNERYQLYGRRPHFFVYYSSGGNNRGQQSRQADAAQAFQAVHPFATVSFAQFGGSADAFLIYMAQHGVLNFGSVTFRPASFFQQFPKLIWGYPPSIEQEAKNYADFVCTRVVPYPTSFAGNNGATPMNGKPRKFGMVDTDDPAFPNLRAFHDAVVTHLKQECNIDIAVDKQYSPNGFSIDASGNIPQYATDNMVAMQSAGVTTILWPGGTEPNQSAAATRLQYFPEWVIAGDGQSDATSYAMNQDQQNWAHAVMVTTAVNTQTLPTLVCYQAFRSVDTTAQDADVQNYGCSYYNDLRQLFTGIQVAGPKLGPTAVDQGFHAIPPHDSTDNRVPACFYEPGDFTCVKDLMVEWYDPQGQTTTENQPGCWREMDTGRRTFVGRWDHSDVNSSRRPGTDICNQSDTNYNVNTPKTP